MAGLVLAVVPLVAAGCGSSSPKATSTTSAPPSAPSTPSSAVLSTATTAAATGGSTITAKDFAFAPQKITVTAGTTVTWKNSDTVAHAIADDAGAFNGPLNPGATFTHAYPSAGTFAFHCSIHPSMTGTVTVTA